MTIRELIQWPYKQGNNYVPWYVIARRIVFWTVYKCGLFVMCAGLALGCGWREAKRTWEEES